ncbi:MAG TPA: hypothetical protein VKZ56_05870 [Membranihabitans sp.]|nr:hypothetical protein [Membranihabitans sp.]
MKPLNLLWILVVGIVLNSCSIEQRLDRKEEKLIGVWVIDKVIYDKYGSLFKRKITSEYRNDVFEFLPGNRVYYYDDDINFEFEGNWDVVAERRYDKEGDKDFEFFIEMHFYDPVYRDAFGYYGYISRLTRNRFHFHVSDGRGELEFRFRRSN